MHSDTVGIDVGQGLQEIHTLHLVEHLHISKMTVRTALKVETTVTASTTVNDEEDIVAVGHIVFPGPGLIVPRLLDIGGVWAAVDIDYRRIFAGRIESYRQDKAVIERRLAISGSERTALDLGHTVFAPWTFALLKGLQQLGTGCGTEFQTTENIRFRPTVSVKRTGRRKIGTVHTDTVVKQRATTAFEIHTIDILTDVSALIGYKHQTAGSRVKSKKFKVFICTGSQLTLLTDTELSVGLLHMEHIKMVETVALTLINEPRSVPRNEGKRVLGLHKTGIRFGIEHTQTLTGLGGISHEFTLVLAAGQFHEEDITLVGRP